MTANSPSPQAVETDLCVACRRAVPVDDLKNGVCLICERIAEAVSRASPADGVVVPREAMKEALSELNSIPAPLTDDGEVTSWDARNEVAASIHAAQTWLERALATPPSPALAATSGGGLDREAVARIIAPGTFELIEHYTGIDRLDGLTPEQREPDVFKGYPSLEAERSVAYAKADAILALSPPSADADKLLGDTGAQAVIRNGKIEISVSVDALPLIVSGSCAARNLSGLWKVTDEAEFAKEVCHALNSEREDGTTKVHLMFDAAFDHVIEQGGEGIDPVCEADFEDEAERIQALARLSTTEARG